MTTANITLPKADVIGPYSEWPRKRRTSRARLIASVGGVAGAAVFVHCVVPLIVA